MRFIAAIALLFSGIALNAQIYTAKAGATSVTFFSKAPLEDIEAVNKGGVIVFKNTTGDIQARLTIKSFKFKNELMEEHFNENYLESEKYPYCEFKGKVNEPVDYSKDGEYKVTVTGEMNLHGVKKTITIPGTITVKNGLYTLNSKFQIKVADYNIKVPSMYVQNIAEVVDVTFITVLEPMTKKQ